jgi:hypothetical protein
MEKYLYWSFQTGEFFDVLEDEIETLTPFQVRLKKKPKSNCNRCYGRFYEGKNIKTGLYIPCQRCRKTCIDYHALYDGGENQLELG